MECHVSSIPDPGSRPGPISPKARTAAAVIAAAGLLLAVSGCGGSSAPRWDGPTDSGSITPLSAQVATGTTLQFTAKGPVGLPVGWTLDPPTLGTISPTGLFTAAGSAGTGSVKAVWATYIPVWASARVTLVAARTGQAPASSNPGTEPASGGSQTNSAGNLTDHAIIGEALAATTSTSANGQLVNRTGFDPVPN